MTNIESFPGVSAPASGSDLAGLSQAVLEALPSAVVIAGKDRRVTAVNCRAIDLFGRPLRIGIDDCENFLTGAQREPSIIPRRETPLTSVLATGESIRAREVVVDRPDGTRVHALVSAAPLWAVDGDIEGVCATFELAGAQHRALEAAHEREARLLDLLNALPAALYTTDAEGRVTFFNKAASDLAGREPELGKDQWCISASLRTQQGAPLPLDQCPMAIALKEDRAIRDIEVVAERPDGSRIPLLPFPTPIHDREGMLLGGVNMLVDITKLKHAEEAAARRMEELDALYRFSQRSARAGSIEEIEEAAIDAILAALRCDRAAILLFDDDRVMRFRAARGLSDSYKSAVEGHSPWPDNVTPEPICIGDVDAATLDDDLRGVVQREGIGALAFIPVTAHGVLVGKFMAYFNDRHEFAPSEIDVAFTLARQLGFTIERARAEIALRESEERFRLVAESAPVMLWMGDAAGKCVYLNRQLREFWGVAEKELATFSWGTTLHPDDAETLYAAFSEAMVAQKGFEVEARYRRGDGAPRILSTSARPRFGPGGEFLGMIGVNVDVTDARASERALRDSEARFRAMADSAPAPIWVTDARGGVEFVNKAMCAFVAKTPNELKGDTWLTLIHADDVDAVTAKGRQAWTNGRRPYAFEARFKDAKGEWRWLNAHASPRLAPEGSFAGYVGIAMDVTDARRAQEDLRASEHRLRLAVVASKAADWSWDAETDRVKLSVGAAGLLGLGALCTWKEFGDTLHADDRQMLQEKVDGAIAEKSAFDVDCRIQHRSEVGAAWISVRGQGVYSESGAFIGMIGLVSDSTERKRQEDAERLLIREVDHRAKNVLAVVQAMARLTPFQSRDQYMTDFTGRIGALGRVHTLLSRSRWLSVSLDDIVRDELEPHALSEPDRVDIHGPAIDLKAEMAQPLSIIVHELATNAAKYGALAKPGGKISIIWCRRPGGGLLIEWTEMCGSEISAPKPEKTGFGSTLIDSAVRQLSGEIRRSWTRCGLKCSVELMPDAALTIGRHAAPSKAIDDVSAPVAGLSNARVLIVEDEPLVALELQALLRDVGAVVIGPATTLDDALLIALREHIDCALLDVNLGGRHVAPLLEVLANREVPYVLVTGYQDPGVAGDVVQKPIVAKQVIGAIAKLLQLRSP